MGGFFTGENMKWYAFVNIVSTIGQNDSVMNMQKIKHHTVPIVEMGCPGAR